MIQLSNFISVDECDGLIAGIKASETKVSGTHYWDGMMTYPENITDQVIVDKMDNVTMQLLEETKIRYEVKGPLYRDSMMFGTWCQGKDMPVHTDNQVLPGQESISTPWRDFTSILYLNDNYDGGELILPESDLSIKPIKGEALLLSTGEPHGVSKITSGIRYTLISWFSAPDK